MNLRWVSETVALACMVLWFTACGGGSGGGTSASSGGASASSGGTSASSGGTSVGLGAASMGGTTATLVPSSGPVALDDLAHEVAIVTCNMYERCIPTTEQTQSACVSHMEKELTDQQFVALRSAVAAGRVAYDGSKIRACFDLYPQLACDYSNVGLLEPTCMNLWGGTVPLGGSCNSNFECASNRVVSSCQSASDTCPGVCTARGGVGAKCPSSQDCQEDLKCDTRDGTCKVPLKLGDSCGASNPNGGVCGGVTQCLELVTGQFQCAIINGPTSRKEGDVCTSHLDCGLGLVCSATAELADSGTSPVFRCRKFSSAGATCYYSLNNPCSTGQYCPILQSAPRSSTALCTPQVAVNQACTGTNIFECVTDSSCTNGTCRARQVLGGACGLNADCYSGNCTNAVCSAPVLCLP